MEIVVYARASGGRLRIYYSHHVVLVREGDAGEFTDRSRYRMPFSPALQSFISQAAMLEFWSFIVPTIQVMPGEVLCPLEIVQF